MGFSSQFEVNCTFTFTLNRPEIGRLLLVHIWIVRNTTRKQLLIQSMRAFIQAVGLTAPAGGLQTQREAYNPGWQSQQAELATPAGGSYRSGGGLTAPAGDLQPR